MKTLHLQPRYWIGHQAYPRNSCNGFAPFGTRKSAINELVKRGFSQEQAVAAIDQVEAGNYVLLSRARGVTEVQPALPM